jgi:hypothetical protein
MRITIYLILLSLLTFIACDKDDDSNPVSPSGETFFALHFDVDNYVETNVDIYFMTTNLSVIPTVTINGQNMKNFGVYEGSIQGWMYNFSYSNTFNYSVTANGKTTSGTINMPSDPYNVICNGTLLDEDNINNISPSNSYNFSWNCNSYDYFDCKWGYNWTDEYTTNTNITFYPDDSNYYFFYLAAISGAMMTPGSQPNVSGSYGKGYVTAELDYLSYTISVSSGLTKIIPKDENKEKIFEKFKRNFNELIFNN